jgi:hypothetical protein
MEIRDAFSCYVTGLCYIKDVNFPYILHGSMKAISGISEYVFLLNLTASADQHLRSLKTSNSIIAQANLSGPLQRLRISGLNSDKESTRKAQAYFQLVMRAYTQFRLQLSPLPLWMKRGIGVQKAKPLEISLSFFTLMLTEAFTLTKIDTMSDWQDKIEKAVLDG